MSLYRVHQSALVWDPLAASAAVEDVKREFESDVKSVSQIENASSSKIDFYHLKLIGTSRLLTVALWQRVAPILPHGLYVRSPRLVFSSYTDGYSLMSLLNHATTEGPSLLLLKTNDETILAICRDDPWINRNDVYGCPETVIIRINNGTTAFWRGVQAQDKKYIYIRSTDEYLMVGAGGSKGIALYSNKDFSRVTSESSEVFCNPPLVDVDVFQIVCIELFSLDIYHLCFIHII